jgi:ribosome-associated protein
MNEVDQISDPDYISKSQIKRECDALQKLGEQLLELQQSELDKIVLPEKLAAAIIEGRKLQARGALKRQRQYIGKLMREVDSKSIEKQLALIQHQHDFNIARSKQTEQWRDRLLSGDNQAVTELIDAYPDIDRQHVNQLVRQSKREQEADKPPASARKLYKYLHQISEQQALASVADETRDTKKT